MSHRIEITDLELPKVLAALYNNTLAPPTPLLLMQDIGEMTEEQAKNAIESYGHSEEDNRIIWFDYVYGRPIKVGIVEDDEGRVWIERADLYDRDSSKTAIAVIEELRDGLQASP